MAVDNVFQMLAQQEINKYNNAPHRRLQELQVQQEEMKMQKLKDEQAYQQRFQSSMAAPAAKSPALSLASLGNPMAGPSNPNSPMGPPQPQEPINIPGIGVPGNMQPGVLPQENIAVQFNRQYQYHMQNGRPDLAQGVMDHQIELSTKAAKVAEHAYKIGGKEGLAAWLQANPTFAPLLGDPSKMHMTKEGVLFPATDDKGQPVPGMYWHRDEHDKPVFKEIKPQTVGEGVAIPDGKGGWMIPAPKAEKDKLQIVEIPSADGRSAQKFSVDLASGTKTPIGNPYKVKSQVTNVNVNNGGGGNDEVNAWATAVKEGRATLQDVPNRGTVRSRVVKAIESGGGVDYAAKGADNKAYAGSVAQQQKQLGSMGSFVKNLTAQIDRVGQIGAELNTFDSRIMNVPLRAARSKIMGSPLQAKYDMYLAEIESEIGKLSTGSTGSVSELSQGAQERWAKIHDKNMSINDMLQLLKETKHAGELRMKSVKDQIDETRSERRSNVGSGKGPQKIGKYTVEVH